MGPVGYWPWGPGTLASGLIAAAWGGLPWTRLGWAVTVVMATAIGVIAAARAERVLGHDDGRIVIDEAAGMGVALLAAPRGWAGAAAAFALFRLFDIAKPPPIGRLQRVPGGWGVVVDDLAAGAIAALLVAAGARLLAA